MPPEHLVLAAILLGLTLYGVLGGADFGAGVWDVITGLRRGAEDERTQIYRAIGPVWEANHVWLIFVLIALWTAFPTAFAGLTRALWLPLFLALAGIVFRGAAYAFRKATTDAEQRRGWEVVFALASTLTPLCLGGGAGAVAAGLPGVDATGAYTGGAFGWLSWTAAFSGLFAVSLCAYLAAVFLVREATIAGDASLTERWRGRALTSGAVSGGLAGLGLVVVAFDAPALWSGFGARGWPLVVLSLAAGVATLAATARRRANLAVVGAALAVAAVILGWGVSQFPALIPPHVTVATAKAPDTVLWAMLVILVPGSLLLLPALGLLLWLFKSEAASQDKAATDGAG